MNPAADRILHLLKRHSAQTADMLGDALAMTSVGARRHLDTLFAAGLVESYDRIEGVGRPRKFWQLSRKGHAQFPDAHADLTVKMIGDIRRVFGEEGLDRLIAERERDMRLGYEKAMEGKGTLADRVQALAELRASEGYMARVERDGGDFLLIEDHCPICAAATACQGFCRSELSIFRMVLGPDAVVERADYLIDGGRRCSYRIRPKI
ncbi:metalloregulator ArsR/SmtB family transcription factor [Parvibaculum sp.]|uniref:helix-turn-helix transcriptional regulator n=1 Tax=Parvibaculum sp. TaxID=2024848 RepID=UPI0027301DE7|nr:metalloregulator ArsR/SmtB family transcription factor [Parvibaculum sp.]MDP1625644.1 transcriptional regulator [Parvibaculum sp.]MDP2149007.1 transcriptional regulator [Parvibaculum sp.]MDP3328625.1 transcriptional regulator [Parvibaculum sp.]